MCSWYSASAIISIGVPSSARVVLYRQTGALALLGLVLPFGPWSNFNYWLLLWVLATIRITARRVKYCIKNQWLKCPSLSQVCNSKQWTQATSEKPGNIGENSEACCDLESHAWSVSEAGLVLTFKNNSCKYLRKKYLQDHGKELQSGTNQRALQWHNEWLVTILLP